MRRNGVPTPWLRIASNCWWRFLGAYDPGGMDLNRTAYAVIYRSVEERGECLDIDNAVHDDADGSFSIGTSC